MNRNQIVSTEDLKEFKNELLSDIEKLLQNKTGPSLKKWLKSSEVKELLKISPGTLQNLRVNGTLPYTKIGGTIYYDSDDIQTMLKENRF
ncbi:MAG: helix-turn-helix domain-containing protein [Marinilabiliaceae bacterium]|nr:helix-turn-helix domain-containing protein [Marinilabiliaceae bacterium]